MKPDQKSISPRAWALMFLLGTLWGASFLCNKVALTEVGVLTIVGFRAVIAAVALWLWVFMTRAPVAITRRALAGFAAMGLLNTALPFTLIVWGQQHIESGLAAILNASTAIFAVPLAALIFADEHLTWRKGLGVVVGFFGVATAIGLQNLIHLDLTSTAQLSCLSATLCYAVAAPVARVTLRDVRFDVSAAGMMTAAAIYMVPAALWVEGVPSFGYQATTWAAILYIALASSAVASLLYYRVLGMAGAGNLSLVTLLVAPMAIVLGAVVYGEALPARAFVGFALLAAGLLIINGKFPKVAR
ncbi:MAG: DMT family transporter [Rhodobacteraceae bacterium]|nr:DMT family transporter [Paracoccaceae bacterium]